MHRSRICGAPIVSPVAFVASVLWRSNTHETAMGYDAVLPAVFLVFRQICCRLLSFVTFRLLLLLQSIFAII
jgi:hypothetical protein